MKRSVDQLATAQKWMAHDLVEQNILDKISMPPLSCC